MTNARKVRSAKPEFFEDRSERVWYLRLQQKLFADDGNTDQEPIHERTLEKVMLDCVLTKLSCRFAQGSSRERANWRESSLWCVLVERRGGSRALIVAPGDRFLARNIAATLQNHGCHLLVQSMDALNAVAEALSKQGAAGGRELVLHPPERGYNPESGTFSYGNGLYVRGESVSFGSEGFGTMCDGTLVSFAAESKPTGQASSWRELKFLPLRMSNVQSKRLAPSAESWHAATHHFTSDLAAAVGLIAAHAFYPRRVLLADVEPFLLPFLFAQGPKESGKSTLIERLGYCIGMMPSGFSSNKNPSTIAGLRNLVSANRAPILCEEAHRGDLPISLGRGEFETFLRHMASGGSMANHDAEYEPIGYPLFDGIDPRCVAADLQDRFFFICLREKPRVPKEQALRQEALKTFEWLRCLMWDAIQECSRDNEVWKAARKEILIEEKSRLAQDHGVSGRPVWIAVARSALLLLRVPEFVTEDFDAWTRRYLSSSRNNELSRTLEFLQRIKAGLSSPLISEAESLKRFLLVANGELMVAYAPVCSYLEQKAGARLGFSRADLMDELGLKPLDGNHSDNRPSTKFLWVRAHRPRLTSSQLQGSRAIHFLSRHSSIPEPVKLALLELQDAMTVLRVQ
jgi:hypothetical protein